MHVVLTHSLRNFNIISGVCDLFETGVSRISSHHQCWYESVNCKQHADTTANAVVSSSLPIPALKTAESLGFLRCGNPFGLKPATIGYR